MSQVAADRRFRNGRGDTRCDAEIEVVGDQEIGRELGASTSSAIARAAAIFIASSMLRALTSSAPRKTPGNASELLTWFG